MKMASLSYRATYKLVERDTGKRGAHRNVTQLPHSTLHVCKRPSEDVGFEEAFGKCSSFLNVATS